MYILNKLSLLITSFFVVCAVYAQTAYVDIEIPIRGKADSNGRIIRQGIGHGTQVTKLDEQGRWAQVQLLDGLVGWLPNRFVSTELSANPTIDALNSKIEQLEEQLTGLKNRSDNSDIELMRQENEQLKAGLVNSFKLQEQNKTLLSANQKLQSERDVLATKVEEINLAFIKHWFLMGICAVFAGGILVIIAARMWPRKNTVGWS